MMRPPSDRILTDTLALIERAPRNEAWVDPDHYAGVVQRIAGVNDVPWEEVQAMLTAPGMAIPGYGTLCRYEWVEAS